MGGKYERLMCDPRKWCVSARASASARVTAAGRESRFRGAGGRQRGRRGRGGRGVRAGRGRELVESVRADIRHPSARLGLRLSHEDELLALLV